MINLLRLRDELNDATYPMATLVCEKIVRGEITQADLLLGLEDLYDDLASETDRYLKVVKHFAEEVEQRIPPDNLSYMKEQQLALTKLSDLIDRERLQED